MSAEGDDRTPHISLDELLEISETRVGDLGRLGLGGLPEALETYEISNPDAVEIIVKNLSAAAFKGFARGGLHPDVSSSEENGEQFGMVYKALQRINADPLGAVTQANALSAGKNLLPVALERYKRLRANEGKVAELRHQKVNMLYGLPYSAIFGLEQGKSIDIAVNLNPDMDTEDIEVFNEEHVDLHTEPILRIENNEVSVLRVDVESSVIDAKQKRRYIDENRDLLKRETKKLNELFNKVRIIGVFPREYEAKYSNSELEESSTSIEDALRLTTGRLALSPLQVISERPSTEPKVDHITIPITSSGTGINSGTLFVARNDPYNDNIRVGNLGHYRLV